MKNTWLFTMLTLLSLPSCIRKEISFLKLDGATVALPIHSQSMVTKDSTFIPTLAVMPGDPVQLFNGEILVAKGYRDETIKIRIDSTGMGYKDEKLYSLVINDSTKKDLVALKDDAPFKTLGSIVLETALDDSVKGLLTRIARQNKHLAISNNPETFHAELQFLLQTFDPWFLLSEMDKNDMSLLKKEQQLTHLFVYLKDSSIAYRLPNLKRLQLLNLASVKPIPDDFLSLNPQISDLLISAGASTKIVKPLQSLRSLATAFPISFDINDLKTRNLKRLVIIGDTTIPAQDLALLHGLTWLGLPADESQTAFDSLTRMLPNIEVIELTAGDNIYDLSWARQWKMLKTMNLYETNIAKVKGLEDLHQLRLLTFPFNSNRDLVKKLRKALPDTTIIPNDGGCVGSLWLLVLAPLFIAFRFFRNKTGNHA